MRTSIESVRAGTTIGTFAPSTSPAASPRVITVSVFRIISAVSMPGAIMMSTWPAMPDLTPLLWADSTDSALSGVNGPSTIAPVMTPCAAMSFRASASVVEGNAGEAPSSAASKPTRGAATPRAVAR